MGDVSDAAMHAWPRSAILGYMERAMETIIVAVTGRKH